MTRGWAYHCIASGTARLQAGGSCKAGAGPALCWQHSAPSSSSQAGLGWAVQRWAAGWAISVHRNSLCRPPCLPEALGPASGKTLRAFSPGQQKPSPTLSFCPGQSRSHAPFNLPRQQKPRSVSPGLQEALPHSLCPAQQEHHPHDGHNVACSQQHMPLRPAGSGRRSSGAGLGGLWNWGGTAWWRGGGGVACCRGSRPGMPCHYIGADGFKRALFNPIKAL